MITQFFGTTGAGKSSNLARIVKEAYFQRGDELLNLCCAQIEADNAKFGLNCPLPDKPPIFVGPHLDLRIEVDFEEFFEPYYLAPYYLGLSDDKEGGNPVQFIPPYSLLIIPEAQRYYDSRQGISASVSGLYEKHRHQKLEIYIESHRPDLIDLNIRRLSHKFVEMRGIENKTNFAGRVEATTWYTREFASWNDVNDYINGKSGASYVDKVVTHQGNIFDSYNSYACAQEFFPRAKDGVTAYDFLESYSQAMEKGFPKGYEEYYKLTEPKGYRRKTA